MTKYLLDTDHVTLHERGNLLLLRRLERIAPEDVAVSAVTVEESLRGRLAILARRIEGATRVHAYAKFIESVQFFGRIEVLAYDLACEDEYQALHAIRIGTQDRKIAATALAYGRILVTRNQRDFRKVPNLLLEDWSSS